MKRIWKALGALGAVALLAGSAAAQEPPKYGQNVGDVAKPVTIKTLDGKDFDTGKVAEKTMFVFVNSVCGLCAKEMNDLAKDRDAFKGVKIYLVSVDVDMERGKSRYEKFLQLFDMLWDPEYKFGEAVGMNSTPSTLVLEKGGKIAYKKIGYRPGDLENAKKAL
jgi:peroxiredoxin